MKCKILSWCLILLLLWNVVPVVHAQTDAEVEESINQGIFFTLYVVSFPLIAAAPVPSVPFFIGTALFGIACGVMYESIFGG